MAEVGVDMAGARSKHVDELRSISFDHVITVCDRARESCPAWLGAGKRHHRSFADPGATDPDSERGEDRLASYRRVRDQIRELVETLPDSLEE
jgi:arsenate reductase